MSWEYFSPQNPCPVCDGITSDCRKPRDSDIILCHHFIDTQSGTPGWKFIKPTNDRIWGIHAPIQEVGNRKSEVGNKINLNLVVEGEETNPTSDFRLSSSDFERSDEGVGESWQQRIEKYNCKRDRQKRTERLKQSQSLSIQERSHHNRSMLQALTLDDHQKSLRARGLSDSAIEDRLLRSVCNCFL